MISPSSRRLHPFHVISLFPSAFGHLIGLLRPAFLMFLPSAYRSKFTGKKSFTPLPRLATIHLRGVLTPHCSLELIILMSYRLGIRPFLKNQPPSSVLSPCWLASMPFANAVNYETKWVIGFVRWVTFPDQFDALKKQACQRSQGYISYLV